MDLLVKHGADLHHYHNKTKTWSSSPGLALRQTCNNQSGEQSPWSYTLIRCVPSRCAKPGDLHWLNCAVNVTCNGLRQNSDDAIPTTANHMHNRTAAKHDARLRAVEHDGKIYDAILNCSKVVVMRCALTTNMMLCKFAKTRCIIQAKQQNT